MSLESYSFPHGVVGIVAQAEELFQRLTQLSEISNELTRLERLAGGYVTIARPDGLPLVTFGLGRVALENASQYLAFSMEKARRLGGAATVYKHVLSRQSRNPAEEKYGGAVLDKRFITSFSGLPEDLDELYSALLQCRIGEATPEKMYMLLKQHGNAWLQRVDFLALTKA